MVITDSYGGAGIFLKRARTSSLNAAPQVDIRIVILTPAVTIPNPNTNPNRFNYKVLHN